MSYEEILPELEKQQAIDLMSTTMPPNTKKCETCNWRESEIGYPSPCPKHTTPSPEKCTKKEGNCASSNQHTQIMDKSVNLEKSEHDGTCRTPECYEKRPTPAVEDWEKEFDGFVPWVPSYLKPEDASRMDKELKSFIRSLLKSDRKRTIEGLEKMKWHYHFSANAMKESELRNRLVDEHNKQLEAFITNLK